MRIKNISRMLPMAEIGKKSIHALNQDEGMIEGQEQLKAYITSYYKGLFGAPAEDILSMDETQTEDIPQVSNEENTFLNSPFTEEEIKKAGFQMEHNKAPGPDGFPAEFINTFGMPLRRTLLSCSNVGMLDNLNCSVLTLGKLFCCLRFWRQKG